MARSQCYLSSSHNHLLFVVLFVSVCSTLQKQQSGFIGLVNLCCHVLIHKLAFFIFSFSSDFAKNQPTLNTLNISLVRSVWALASQIRGGNEVIMSFFAQNCLILLQIWQLRFNPVRQAGPRFQPTVICCTVISFSCSVALFCHANGATTNPRLRPFRAAIN